MRRDNALIYFRRAPTRAGDSEGDDRIITGKITETGPGFTLTTACSTETKKHKLRVLQFETSFVLG
jgi:hypothetical protein